MTKTYLARFQPDVKAALTDAATKTGVSVNTLLDRIVRDAFRLPTRDKAAAFVRNLREAT